ncbi:uncharacterized protein LOC114011468 isoform X2 [Falco peregrinus]|uniref:uncharacterized protein LOC114011468 isoform X2 n=1 Tax=Falco peregrinus TaxID=8954 RepID=UPI000FFC6F60|nr:uncharacterized protein LOC114011468 isoform X2 [Falco peregrinus]
MKPGGLSPPHGQRVAEGCHCSVAERTWGSVPIPQLTGPKGCHRPTAAEVWGGSVTAPQLRGPMGLSPPHGPPHASTFQPTTIQGQPPAPARSQHPSAPRLPSAFHVRLKMSPAGTILCATSPGLRGQPCSPSSWGRHLPPNHLDDYGPGFYCHKCFVQEQQYPPEGAVLSLEIATLPLHSLGAKDAFAAPRPHTWSASESLLALPKTTGRDKAKRRRVHVIFKAGTHLERADGLEGIPVVSGNQEIIHSGGSANDRGAWRPQPGPRGPVILDLTYTEEEMSAHRGTGRARGDERQRMNVNAEKPGCAACCKCLSHVPQTPVKLNPRRSLKA